MKYNQGYGEPPTSMKKFWSFLLRKDLPNDSLSSLNYTIFGLGDRSYEKFNQVAIVLNKRLESLGADLFYPVGLGDDQQDFGYETEFDPWCEELINVLLLYFPDKVKLRDHHIHEAKLSVNKVEECLLQYKHDNNICKIEELKVLTNQDAFRQVYHLSISHNHKYIPRVGDVALIYPKNSENSVMQMLKLCDLEKDDTLRIDGYVGIPKVIRAYDLFESHLDINGVPNRYFCSIAAKYTDNEIHKEKLELFASKTRVILFN
jgi:sulfite reductase alpha subunit-like flavoprotein